MAFSFSLRIPQNHAKREINSCDLGRNDSEDDPRAYYKDDHGDDPRAYYKEDHRDNPRYYHKADPRYDPGLHDKARYRRKVSFAGK